MLMAGTTHALDDLRWLQRFAARLAAQDPEDLAQEVALAATQADGAVGRGWLATGLRHRLRMRHRSDSARRARESAYAQVREPSAEEGARVDRVDRIDRIEVLGALVEALESLEPCDRAIVLGRFFDGRTAVDLGAELDMPPATVRSRLKRSLARLRETLDERFEGERVAWAVAVVSPQNLGAPASTAVGATALLSVKPLLAVGAVVVAVVVAVVGAIGLWLRSPEPSGPAPSPVAADNTTDTNTDDRPTTAPDDAPGSEHERMWRARRAQIASAAGSTERVEPIDAAPLGPDAETATDDALSAQSQAFLDCADDLQIPVVGAVVLRSRILGAPDVGTLYDDVEIVGMTESRPALLECVREHMYGYLGGAPSEPFEATRTVTTLGRRPPELDPDAWAQRIFDTVVTAHLEDLRACADGSALEGAALQLRFERDPAAAEVTVLGDDIPESTAACIVDEAGAWMFPRPMLEGRTLSRTL